MNLLDKETLWVFLLPSTDEVEPRHICDVAFGVSVLLSKGIEKSKIKVLIDKYIPALGDFIFLTFGVVRDFDIEPVNEYFKLFDNSECKNTVIFVTGHGNLEGFDCSPHIKPVPFYNVLKNSKKLENAVVFMGQCEAGVYNYVSLKADNNCNIVAIGATGLQDSISTSEIVYKGKWSANVFLTFIFAWIRNPYDIDGDGEYSVIDAFKYASYKTLDTCKSMENRHNLELERRVVELHRRNEQLLEKKKEIGLTPDEELELTSIGKVQIMIRLDQQPWILNAIPATQIYF